MTTTRIDRICTLLKGIETGDPDAVKVISPTRYIQHNPQTHTGREGLAELFGRLSKASPRVNIVRAFEDGDFVSAHTEYDFASRRIGFEIFRFEGDLAVEHWDNIQPRQGPNPSGHSMVDGPTAATDFDRTEANRDLVRAFIETVPIAGKFNSLDDFVNTDDYTEHHPNGVDGFAPPGAVAEDQGNFVLVVSEGARSGLHFAFYDLYRIEANRIVEHWDTTEAIAPPQEWKHDNGKF